MPKPSNERTLSFGVDPTRHREKVNRWAFIVGISKYKYEGINLKYAHNDANELYDLIQTPSGGDFEAKRIKKFIDEEATTAKITGTLRSFLQDPDVDDLVLIYFACHGAPDPRTGVVYLLTHDTDPDNIPGTAFPMREIDAALKDNLSAERVVIIADTCHSAAVGGKIGRRGKIGDSAVINRYLQDLSESKAGLALLTSAQASESSLEGEQWGGGHGVFTHFLLQGMRGKADRNKDGTVSVGELFEYVRDEVKRETNNAQHPVIGTNAFDPKMPLAITGGTSAEDHLQLGICLNELGRLLNEPSRFNFARDLFQDALTIAARFREKLPEAQLHKGLAEMALADHSAALATFQQAINDDKNGSLPEIHLYLGVTLARLGKLKQAATSFRKFLKLRPDDARGKFVEAFVSRLDGSSTTGSVHVLLIGIGTYEDPAMTLPGPENDIRMVRDLLVGHYEIDESCIRTLSDTAATREAIIAEFERLAAQSASGDQVLVYFSGHAFQGDEAENYLVTYDFKQDDPASISAMQLHKLLNKIPASQKTMIIDSHATTTFVQLAQKDSNYRLLLGTSPDLMAYEAPSESPSGQWIHVGRFTQALVKQLAMHSKNTPLGSILPAVADSLATMTAEPQRPIYVGNMDRSLLVGSGGVKEILEAFDFSMRRNYDALSLDEVNSGYQSMSRNGFPFLQLNLSFGRAFLEKGQYAAALAALQLADRSHARQAPEALLALGAAQLHNQKYEDAMTSLQEYANLKIDPATQLDVALQTMSELKKQRKHALLIGIDQYQAEETSPLRGAVNDVHLVKETLIDRHNFAEADIHVITDSKATNAAIIAAFNELLQKSQQEPALFYFSGYGSFDSGGEPTIVPADRGAVSYPNDIRLRDLAEKTEKAGANNLITIIDAGWQENVRLPYGGAWGSRFAPPQVGVRPATRELPLALKKRTKKVYEDWQPDHGWTAQREQLRDLVNSLKIGRLSIYHVSIQSAFGQQRGLGGEPVVEAEFPMTSGQGKQIHGVMTHALMDVLRQEEVSGLTFRTLATAVARRLKWLQPFMIGDNPDEAVFTAPVQERKVNDLAYTRARQHPARLAIQLLNRLIEQAGGQHAIGNLNLGVAYAALGEFKESRDALEKAIEESGKNPIPEAHCYLGRVLYELNELDPAVSELREALKIEPQNITANYFFGHAVRKRTEQQTLVEAAKAFELYLNSGAPLGNRDEIQAILNRWSNRGTGTGTGTGAGTGIGTGIGTTIATGTGTSSGEAPFR